MKTAVIAHGWGGSPDEPMLKWIRSAMEAKGFSVIAPLMPHPDTPTIDDWVACLRSVVPTPNENTYFVGHSVGCQTILRYMETLPTSVQVGQVILVAPWIKLTVENLDAEEEESIAHSWMNTPIDFEKVKRHSHSIIGIFSTNDPFVPLEENKHILEEKVNARTIVLENRGHFTKSDGVSSLPELLEEF